MANPDHRTSQSGQYIGAYDASSGSSDDEAEERDRSNSRQYRLGELSCM